MRFIKCLSVFSFAVADREDCRITPVEMMFIFSSHVKLSLLFSQAPCCRCSEPHVLKGITSFKH